MNIAKILFSSMLFMVFGMFSSTAFAQAGEAVFDSFDVCDQARVAYTPTGRNRMTSGQVMTISDIHPNFSGGVCVHSPQVVRRINGRATVVSGWVFLLGDFPVVKVGGRYFMQACSNPIDQIGAPRAVAQTPTQIYTDQPQQIPDNYIPPRQQQPVQVVYVDRPQQQYELRESAWKRAGTWLLDRVTNATDNYIESCMYVNGRCSGRSSRDRYVIINNGGGNQQGYPCQYRSSDHPDQRCRRPREPIYGNDGGTQWREPRQWDGNLSRGNASEPIRYDNSSQWGPVQNQWR